jgi:hypothetical protein
MCIALWPECGFIIHAVAMQVPGDALAREPAFADIVPGDLWETAFVHLQEVRPDPSASGDEFYECIIVLYLGNLAAVFQSSVPVQNFVEPTLAAIFFKIKGIPCPTLN